jgi:hypothetical protein
MKKLLLVVNSSFLFLCVSMYFGTGWSLVLFSFPVEPQLTVDNYYLQFVPPVTIATHFFTYMTALMCVSCVIMAIGEWKTPDRWIPAIVLVLVLTATGLTVWKILDLNKQMAAHITDPELLKDVFRRWMSLNRVRVAFWTLQWITLMVYFGRKAISAQEVSS